MSDGTIHFNSVCLRIHFEESLRGHYCIYTVFIFVFIAKKQQTNKKQTKYTFVYNNFGHIALLLNKTQSHFKRTTCLFETFSREGHQKCVVGGATTVFHK